MVKYLCKLSEGEFIMSFEINIFINKIQRMPITKVQEMLKQYEKEQLKHYSKMRGFLVTYQNYQNDMQNDYTTHRDPVEKERQPEKSWEKQVLDGEIDLTGIPKNARNDFYNAFNELQVLQEKVDGIKKKNTSYGLHRQIMELEQGIQEKFVELRWMYEQMKSDAMVEDHDIVGFDEEMREGAIYYPNSYGELCRKTK